MQCLATSVTEINNTENRVTVIERQCNMSIISIHEREAHDSL